MREAISHSGLRMHHWMILLGALPTGSSTWASSSHVASPPGFANRPEVARAFSDPNFGRGDALILLFSTLFLGPLALLLGLMALVFLLAVFGGFLPPDRALVPAPRLGRDRLGDGRSGHGAVAAERAWLPRSIWFLGLLARACRIVVNVADRARSPSRSPAGSP